MVIVRKLKANDIYRGCRFKYKAGGMILNRTPGCHFKFELFYGKRDRTFNEDVCG